MTTQFKNSAQLVKFRPSTRAVAFLGKFGSGARHGTWFPTKISHSRVIARYGLRCVTTRWCVQRSEVRYAMNGRWWKCAALFPPSEKKDDYINSGKWCLSCGSGLIRFEFGTDLRVSVFDWWCCWAGACVMIICQKNMFAKIIHVSENLRLWRIWDDRVFHHVTVTASAISRCIDWSDAGADTDGKARTWIWWRDCIGIGHWRYFKNS